MLRRSDYNGDIDFLYPTRKMFEVVAVMDGRACFRLKGYVLVLFFLVLTTCFSTTDDGTDGKYLLRVQYIMKNDDGHESSLQATHRDCREKI